MNDLDMLKVTNGGDMLDHSPGYVKTVYLTLGNQHIKLRTVKGYNKRGGINNAEMGGWIKARYGNTRGLILLFMAEYDEVEKSICYKLIGKVDPV